MPRLQQRAGLGSRAGILAWRAQPEADREASLAEGGGGQPQCHSALHVVIHASSYSPPPDGELLQGEKGIFSVSGPPSSTLPKLQVVG